MPSAGRLAFLALGLAALAVPARGESQLIGDPGGLRTHLGRLGLTLQLFSNHFGAWMGRGATTARDELGHSSSYDLFAHADLEELVGSPGSSFLFHAKGQYDRSVNDEVGALSDPIDDADFEEGIYVDELWLQQDFFDGRARLRVGFLEQQTTFDRNAYANSEDLQFLATFLDNGGVVPLPNGLGATLVVSPTEWLELAVGLADADNRVRRAGFDTAFDDFESLTAHLEAAVVVRLPGALPGRWRVGAFRDGREKSVFGSPGTRRGDWGGYASLDQRIYREDRDGEQGLGLFLRLGAADQDVNRIAWFWSAGFQYTGLLPGREDDVLGLGAWQAIGSQEARDVDRDLGRETGFELYYRVALCPWLQVTPDFQLILDPGAAKSSRTAILGALRLRVAF